MNKNAVGTLYRWIFWLQIVALVLLLFVITASGTGLAVNGQNKVLYISTTNPQSDIDLQFMASHYDLIVDSAGNLTVAQLDRLHNLNPALRVIKYLNGTNVHFGTTDYTWIDNQHPDWFLLDSQGRRVVTKANNYGLKLGNSGVQDWFAQKSYEMLTTKPYDGIFLDVILASPYYQYWDSQMETWVVAINPDTGAVYTYPQWQTHQQQKLDVIKQRIGTKLLIFNGISYNCYFPGEGGEGYKFWAGNADGAMIEGFIRWASDSILSFRSEANWKKDVDMLYDSLSRGKIVLAETGFDVNASISDEERKRVGMYAFASFLLAEVGERSYFTTQNVDILESGHVYETPFDNIWLTEVGYPLGIYYKQDNVYQRDFSNGKVLVNPNATNTYVVNLGNVYTTLDGQIVSMVALPPHTGMILLNYVGVNNPSPISSPYGVRPNGALIKTLISLKVYLLEEGKKRWITSPAAFLSHGFRWDRIVTVSDTEMATYPAGSDLRIRPGTLIKGSGPAVYLVDFVSGSYTKRWITSPAVFEALGYRWGDILTVSELELASYTEGAFISGPASHMNGTLIKTASNPSVYLLEEGKKRWITSPASFISNGFRWDAIVTVSDAEMANYTVGPNLQARPGTLLKSSGPAVYVTDLVSGSYQKRWITSPSVFQSLGFHWEDIFVVSDVELSRYADALSLSSVSQGDSGILGLRRSESPPRRLIR